MSRAIIDTGNDGENDAAFRLIIIVGDAILSQAEENPAFGEWLLDFLDQRIEDENDRALFQLGPRPKSRPLLSLVPPAMD